MPIKAERGYVIPAFNTDIDYESLAHRLADSILHWHPDANITILTNKDLRQNLGGWANDPQVFALSPYRQTIKLEADMYCASPIDHWWTLFETRDVVISRGCRTFYDKPATSRFYRRIFDENNLPDLYNAITYWRLSKTAQDFFTIASDIFSNWSKYKTLLRFPEERPSTDVVYAMAAVIIGEESVTLPSGLGPTIVHMKKHILSLKGEDWTRELVWEIEPNLRINTVAQWGLVHYNQKHWCP